MRKKIVFLAGIFLFTAVILGLFYYYGFLNFSGNEARAVSTDNTIGWAWSENIGWISMNCYNDFDGNGTLETHASNPNCSNSIYGVNIDLINGPVTGYAWSKNIGWISFNSLDLTGCPVGTCEARVNLGTKALSGWAKILNLGENGWLRLQGPVVAAPASYALCRNCMGGNCDFCYELSANSGSGKIGTACSSCAGTPPSCGSCSNIYQYGVSALPYSIKDLGNRYVLEGWAWNGEKDAAVSEKPIGWIHFNYAYANENLPFSFNSFTATPSQVPPPSACISADLSWELASWSTGYEIKKADNGGLGYTVPQNCGALPAGDYSTIIPVNLSNCSAISCLYQDSTLRENRYYCYKVFALNDSGLIENTDGPKQVKTPLCAPSNLTAIETICGEITLNWSDKAEETGYKVYHSLADTDSTSTATLIASLGANIISYKDEDIIPRKTYYYLLTALTNTDESPPSKISAETLCYKGAEWEEK